MQNRHGYGSSDAPCWLLSNHKKKSVSNISCIRSARQPSDNMSIRKFPSALHHSLPDLTSPMPHPSSRNAMYGQKFYAGSEITMPKWWQNGVYCKRCPSSTPREKNRTVETMAASHTVILDHCTLAAGCPTPATRWRRASKRFYSAHRHTDTWTHKRTTVPLMKNVLTVRIRLFYHWFKFCLRWVFTERPKSITLQTN